MAKKTVEPKKMTGREKHPVTREEMRNTAKALQKFAVSFEEVAKAMEERNSKQVLVTGKPSVDLLIERLEKHYLSCLKALKISLAGIEIPRHSDKE